MPALYLNEFEQLEVLNMETKDIGRFRFFGQIGLWVINLSDPNARRVLEKIVGIEHTLAL